MNLFLLNQNVEITIPESLLITLVAIAIIIGILAVIMFLVWLMPRVLNGLDFLKGKTNKAFENVKAKSKKSKNENADVQKAALVEEIVESGDLAVGSAGKIKLHNVSEKDAAMVMAITAHKLQKPINELRFISIKEIEK